MSSDVRLPPMTPASSATVSTSPFSPPPSITRLIVSAETATSASATARRAVGGFALTSTIRGRPRSTWVRRRRSARVASVRSIGPPVGTMLAAVEPAQLDLRARLGPLERLRDHGERVGERQRRQDVAPLPARQAHADAALVVA